jgi:hypothetical protein
MSPSCTRDNRAAINASMICSARADKPYDTTSAQSALGGPSCSPKMRRNRLRSILRSCLQRIERSAFGYLKKSPSLITGHSPSIALCFAACSRSPLRPRHEQVLALGTCRLGKRGASPLVCCHSTVLYLNPMSAVFDDVTNCDAGFD